MKTFKEFILECELVEEKKPLPVSKMSRQARKKAFNLGSQIHNPSDEYGSRIHHSVPVNKDNKLSKQIRKMSKVGGSKVKSHIKKGFEQGSYYDQQDAKSKYYWLQKL